MRKSDKHLHDFLNLVEIIFLVVLNRYRKIWPNHVIMCILSSLFSLLFFFLVCLAVFTDYV